MGDSIFELAGDIKNSLAKLKELLVNENSDDKELLEDIDTMEDNMLYIQELYPE